MSKPTNIKEFMAQQAPNYKRGWEDCLRAVNFYLEHEGMSKPRLTTYCAAVGDTCRYLFEGFILFFCKQVLTARSRFISLISY